MQTERSHLAVILYPMAGVLVLLAVWHLVAVRAWVPDYLLPQPLQVAAALIANIMDGTIWAQLKPTLIATAIGYLASAAIAIFFAALISESRWAERALLLPLVAVQATPKVAIAPLVFLWAGFDIGGNVVLVALICFFPIFTNALAGFRAFDPNLVDLFRAAGASRAHIWRHVKLPGSLVHLFAGLEVAVAFALIGCVVMEFISSTRGMGFLIQDASTRFDLPLSFGGLLVLGVVGLLCNAAVRLLRTRLLFWDGGHREPGHA
ncbi:MAG: ABC transporter permease [Burkholderiaceae bacterium]